ncbi:protein of unknown function [Candidatus Filomicrobium marinum]|uniref:Uncharacterized protein n=1 Tax=Candidatus Filomicrobium marinum TaxID=1608628 RepID=A0A0D6JIP8_9HYPH|nr:protein of unknown function [Candidatus Filomicrobium marinum]
MGTLCGGWESPQIGFDDQRLIGENLARVTAGTARKRLGV